MSIFGWSLPPGCNSLPGEEEYPCEVCGLFPDYCICPECPECGTQGDPECYESHGLVRTDEQIATLSQKQKDWEQASKEESEFWEKWNDVE